MTSIGVGLIGTGFMGRAHALAFHAVGPVFAPRLRPRLELVADVEPSAAERACQRYGFARSTGDWRALVEDPRIDLVAITAPNALHKEMALAAIAAGKHVYCEKPLAPNAEDAKELADAAETSGVMTLVGYNYLRSPAIQYAKRLVASGELGDISHLRVIFDEDYLADPATPHSWRTLRATAGSGTLGDLGSHAISLARFLAGPVTSVVADLATVIPERPVENRSSSEKGSDGPVADEGRLGKVENEDIVQVLLRFAGGASGFFGSSRVAWGRKNGLDFELYGAKGAVRFSQERFNELQLFLSADRGDANGFRTILTGPAHPPYGQFVPAAGHGLGFNDLKTAEVAHLLAGIAGKEELYPDFREGWAIEAVCDAILLSAKERRWIDVEGS